MKYHMLKCIKNKRKNVIIPILLLAIIIAAVSYGTYMTRNLTIRRMKDSLHIQASNQAAALHDKIESKFDLLNGLGTIFTADNIKDLDFVLENLLQCAQKTDFISVNFAYPDGTAYRNDGKEMDLSDRWYFRQCLNGKPAIEYLSKGKLVDEERFGIAVPIIIDGQVEGVLIGDYNNQLFQNLFETVESNISDFSFVCDSEGRVIAGTDYAKEILQKETPGMQNGNSIFWIFDETEELLECGDRIKEDMKAGSSGEATYTYHGITRYTMYEPVGMSDWYVVTIMQQSQIFEEAQETARISYIMLAAVMLAVICIIYYLISRERRIILQEKKKSEELRYTLAHDELTGVLAEKAFQQQVEERLKTAKPEEYFIVYMDIYKFKLINEMFGSDKGDAILKIMGEVLEAFAKENNGLCGRISADKFIAFLPNRQEIIDEFYTKKLRKNRIIQSEIYLHYGIYIIRNTNIPVTRMIDSAQLAQKSVKGNYDNCVSFYDDEIKEKILHEQEIINTMAQALKNHEFIIYLQPQYNYRSGRIDGAEALVRWNSPTKGLISPLDFIPIFETNGFIVKLDEYVWEEVCKLLRSWIDRGCDPLPISINVSRTDLLRGSVSKKLQSLIKQYDLPPELIRVEITESAYMDNPQQLILEINRLRTNDFIVEMDDFGSGYSSLNMLKDVPINVLKTDLKFLSSAGIGERKDRILDNIINMAHEIGLLVIAEGVETKEQADYLMKLDCELMQGYYFSRPVPVEEFEEIVYGHNK